MSKRGVFVRAYGWFVQPRETGSQYEAERIEGLLAVRNSKGTYDCLPVTRHDTCDQEPKEGVVWLSTFLAYGTTALVSDFIWGKAAEIPNNVEDSHTIETVELPAFKSVQALREYLYAGGTRRTSQVIDPIGPPKDTDSRWYRWWWEEQEQWKRIAAMNRAKTVEANESSG